MRLRLILDGSEKLILRNHYHPNDYKLLTLGTKVNIADLGLKIIFTPIQ